MESNNRVFPWLRHTHAARRSTPGVAVVLALSLWVSATVFAEEVPPDAGRKRPLVEWVDTLTKQCQVHDIQWTSLAVWTGAEIRGTVTTAGVEVIGPERFSKFSNLVVYRIGAAELKDISEDGGPKERKAVFDVALAQPPVVSGEGKQESPAPALAKVVRAACANPGVSLRQLSLTRAVLVSEKGSELLQVPLQLTLEGALPQALAVISSLPNGYPHLVNTALKVRPDGGRHVVTLSARLLVLTKMVDGPTPPDAAGVRALVLETLTAGQATTPTVSAAAPLVDSVRVEFGVPIKGPDGLREALERALSVPGIRSFDLIRYDGESRTPTLTGLLHFPPLR
ncbi:MAG: hypothetical protein HY815_06335 [Candidatus Riflebacteria bacterium]|nr:hypothetical protein [Candidatus Riflebacteria bacterium]